MFRVLLAMGTLILELTTMASEGVMAATLVATGTVVASTHLLLDSESFHALVSRMTGCDLPEVLSPLDERPLQSAQRQRP